MAIELINWFQDLREHARVSRHRRETQQPGRGFDYAREDSQDGVDRIVERVHPRRMKLRFTEIIAETPTTKTFRFLRVDGLLPPFRAGQYINVFVDVNGVLTSRPYSIASPPGIDHLDLTVRDNPSGFVAPFLLRQLQIGNEVQTTGPVGSFYHEPLIDGDDLVFLAGGSGITPFMSMIRDAVRRSLPLTIHLLYGSRVPGDVIFAAELADTASRYNRLRYSLVISHPPPGYKGLAGFLDAKTIRERIGNVQGKTFYICGPNIMYGFCLGALKELGVPQHKVRREPYGPPSDVTKEPGWPRGLLADRAFVVEVEGRKAIRAQAGEPLLVSLERNGLAVPSVCRSGECSACRTRLLSGRVFMPALTGLREADRQAGCIHACVSYPLENLRIRI